MPTTRSKKRRITSDVFTPKGHSEEEIELATRHSSVVIEQLGTMLTEARIDTINKVVENRTSTLHVAVEGVHDPHNTAAIMRTADAFGLQNVHIIEGKSSFRSSAAVTQGAHKWIDVSVYRDTPEFVRKMREQKLKILVAAMDGAIDVDKIELDCPHVLVFGNEAEGISQQMFELADGAFKIPMFGFVESFNVSVAAAISVSTLRSGGGGDLERTQQDVLKARYYLKSVRAGNEIVKRHLKSH